MKNYQKIQESTRNDAKLTTSIYQKLPQGSGNNQKLQQSMHNYTKCKNIPEITQSQQKLKIL